uniref:Uncharacterized protein n=1 Tax=Arundo donax TaxID=35708 RepID=A0A0A9I230_ARUDO
MPAAAPRAGEERKGFN